MTTCGLTASIPFGALTHTITGRFAPQNRSPEVCLNKKCLHFLQNTNAQAEARATGTDTRAGKKPALWPVASSATLGAWEGRDTVLTCPLYPFNSFFSSLRKRQSVPCSMIFWGLDLIMPASCRRRA
jgi:hypothetical protein